MNYSLWQVVKVVDADEMYDTYTSMAKKMNLKNWKHKYDDSEYYDESNIEGKKAIIKVKELHDNGEDIVYGITMLDGTGREFIFSQFGIESVDGSEFEYDDTPDKKIMRECAEKLEKIETKMTMSGLTIEIGGLSVLQDVIKTLKGE